MLKLNLTAVMFAFWPDTYEAQILTAKIYIIKLINRQARRKNAVLEFFALYGHMKCFPWVQPSFQWNIEKSSTLIGQENKYIAKKMCFFFFFSFLNFILHSIYCKLLGTACLYRIRLDLPCSSFGSHEHCLSHER